MKKCPICGSEFYDDKLFCPSCGAKLTEVLSPPRLPHPDQRKGRVWNARPRDRIARLRNRIVFRKPGNFRSLILNK